MTRKTIAVIAVIAVILVIFCCAAMIIWDEPSNPLYQMGKAFKSLIHGGQDSADGEDTVLAKYGDSEITAKNVAYKKQLNMISNSGNTDDAPTDYQIVNQIAQSMIIIEEARRRGLDATQEEIDAMISNTEYAYSLPQGKEMLDMFLIGAGITFDEYLQLLREDAPAVIAKQKLLDAVGMEYCDANGIEFTKINPPAELLQAQQDFIEELFSQHASQIEYYIDVPE